MSHYWSPQSDQSLFAAPKPLQFLQKLQQSCVGETVTTRRSGNFHR